MSDDLNNMLSQEEIDKLAGLTESSESNKDINISNMLSQDEINEVSNNLNELENNNASVNTISQEEIDKLTNMTDENKSEKPEAPVNILSQDEINKLSEKSPVIDEDTNSFKKLDANEEDEVKETTFESKDETENESSDSDSLFEESMSKSNNKKKIFIIVSIILALLFVLIWFLFINNSDSDTEEIKRDMNDKNNIKIVKTKTQKTKSIENAKDIKPKKKIVNKIDKIKGDLKKGSELFFSIFNDNEKQGIEDAKFKSQDLIVEHDMDISDENLRKCFAFDLTASLVGESLSKINGTKLEEYFSVDNLDKRYRKRLLNAGNSEEEADEIIFKWGKMVMKTILEEIKPDILKKLRGKRDEK